MTHLEKLSYCGIYCGGCLNFKKNYNCQGCRYEENMLSDCPLRACAIAKELIHCGECEEFPCKELIEFYEDGVPLHDLAYKNILRIKEIGIDKWLIEQEELSGSKGK
ncbi:MAG: DUF3795 domain-containing protein [Candidatus Stygibacter frigidus]|nr:DUF3795 domain-containing protein [Candidatus Stygibacter frigidus]